MQAAEPGVWRGGRLYNPEDGRDYKGSLALPAADRLVVDGCMLVFCQNQVWRRADLPAVRRWRRLTPAPTRALSGRIEARVRLLAPAVQDGAGEQHRDGDEPEGALEAPAPGGGSTQAERADAVAQVAPEAVDADAEARQFGCAMSATAALRFGYSIAMPSPATAADRLHHAGPWPSGSSATPAPETHMPPQALR